MFYKVIICLVLSVSLAFADEHAKIISSSRSFDSKSGAYKYSFLTSNGIKHEESGIGGKFMKGEASYHTPEGKSIHLSYTADEHGFQAEGDHLPTPVPLPKEYYEKIAENENYHAYKPFEEFSSEP